MDLNATNEALNNQPFLKSLGVHLEEASVGNVTLSMENNPMLHQQLGFIHAGAVTTLADSAAGYAAFTTMPEGSSVVSVEFKINLMRPAVGKKLFAKATVLKSGKTIVIAEAEVTNDTGKLIAKMVATMFVVTEDTYQK